MRVLVVDDIETNRKLLRVTLESEGFEVVTAADGVEALAALEREQIDGIISDILMPNMDGYRLCYEVRQHDRFRNLPFIFYSSTYTSASDEKLAREMGADEFLRKPVTAKLLLEVLHRLTTRPHALAGKTITPSRGLGLMKQYSERLVGKLEEQNAELRQRTAELELEITERKAIQVALRASEERYRDLVESTHDLVQSIAPDGHFVFANRVWLQTLGYTQKELPHLTIADVIHPESLAHYQQLFSKVMAGEAVDCVEAKFLTKDGREIFVEGSASPRFYKGRVIATHGFLRDVTQRKLVEKELGRSEEKYRSLVEQAPDAIFIASPNLHFIDVNARACELSGYTRDEILRMSIPDFMAPEDIVSAPLKLNELREGKTVVAERRLRPKDGTLVPVEVSSKILSDGRLQAIVRDITERKRAEEALRQTEQQYESLVHSIDGIVCEIDPRTFSFTFVSKQAERLLGYPLAQWLNEPNFWADHIHSDDREWAVDFCLKATARKEHHQFEYRMIAADGRAVWLKDNVTVSIMDDESVRLRRVMVDITERKQAEQKIRTQLDELLRWQEATLGREDRVLELKRQVNELRQRLGEPSRYASQVGARETDQL